MTKTFCDRCGKEITKTYGWIAHRTLYASIRLLPGKKREEWSERADQYICPECEDSYIRWFMNPETKDRAKLMYNRAYIISRTLEHKIAVAENNDQNTLFVTLDVLKEILAILKEQEPKPPSLMQDAEGVWATCPTCGNKLHAILAMKMNGHFPKFCSECGQEVKWHD